jgi:hypothetical protein
MARAAETDAQNASSQYNGYATSALNNYNADAGETNDQISSLEGNNPYTSKTQVQNQNLLTSGAMNATNTAAKQQLNDAALRTGTNTASLGRTISSNARAGQRTMDDYNAQTALNNTDKSVQLQQGLIGDRQNAANSEAGVYGTSSGQQTAADGQLVTLQGQQDQMWGNVISGAAGAGGAAITKF